MSLGRGGPNIRSAGLTGRSRGAGTTSVVLFWFVVYNKLLFKIGPASSPYAPGEVTRGSQARTRWPWAADSPPVRPEGTWVARGLIGGAAPQAPAVDGGDGGTHRLAAPHRAHIGVLSRRAWPVGGRGQLR